MYGFLTFLLLLFLCVNADFNWNPPIASGLSVQTSANPHCVGGFDITLNDVIYPCFGGSIETVPAEENCPNGLKGIMLNDTLVCGVVTNYLLPGEGGCDNGGYTFLSNTQNFTNCYTSVNNTFASFIGTTNLYDYLLTPFSQNNVQQYLDALTQLLANRTDTILTLGGQVNALFYNQGLINATANSALQSYSINSTTDGASLVSSSSRTSSTMKSVVDSPTVTVTSTPTNVSFNALLTFADLGNTGVSIWDHTLANTGYFLQLFSAIPGFSIAINGTNIVLSSTITCSDGRPSILFNGISVCNWQFNFGAPTLLSPGGRILFISDLVNTSWPMEGPAAFIPANPSLWPANTTLTAQALNYLGIYRAQNGVCPSAGQAMITVNGVQICGTRIDPGPSILGCKNGVYNLDSGIGSGTVCLPQVLDGSEITVNTLSANLSAACGFLNDVTDSINCIYNNFIVPGLVNQTSAATIVYTPPFTVNCQTQFTLSAMLTFLIVGQLPSNTFNIYVNSL